MWTARFMGARMYSEDEEVEEEVNIHNHIGGRQSVSISCDACDVLTLKNEMFDRIYSLDKFYKPKQKLIDVLDELEE